MHIFNRLAFVLSMALLSTSALASSTGMPYEDGMTRFAESINGPVVASFGVVVIVLGGLGFAFASQISEFFKWLFGVIAILGIVLNAAGLILWMGGSKGATVIVDEGQHSPYSEYSEEGAILPK